MYDSLIPTKLDQFLDSCKTEEKEVIYFYFVLDSEGRTLIQ